MITEDRPKFANLTEDQQQRLRHWVANLATGGKPGLWVCGERYSGTSYIAWLAMNKVWREHKEWTHAKYTAKRVMEAKRDLWNLERNPNRYDSEELTVDYYQLVEDFKGLQALGYLWIDNLHDGPDMEFWMRHVQPELEERVKDGKVTVIATDMAPDHPVFEKVRRLIESLFVVVKADYAGR